MADDMNNIHKGHRKRLKERFIKEGLSSFEPHEVLEFMLYYVIKRGNTNEQGHRLLHEFKSLEGVFNASLEQLREIDGIGFESALYIKFLGELFSYYNRSKNKTDRLIPGTEEAKRFFLSLFEYSSHEEFYVICLNSAYNIIRIWKAPSGGLDSVSVDTKQVMKFVLSNNAYSVILAHNHPSGALIPSDNDIMLTKLYEHNFRLTDIKLIDHIIVANGDYISIKKHPMYNKRKGIV